MWPCENIIKASLVDGLEYLHLHLNCICYVSPDLVNTLSRTTLLLFMKPSDSGTRKRRFHCFLPKTGSVYFLWVI
jgi:hypothetical protein